MKVPDSDPSTRDQSPQLFHFDVMAPSSKTAEAPSLQLVPIQQVAEDKTALVNYDLDTFGNTFTHYRSFYRMSRDQDKEARVTAYKELMNFRTQDSGLRTEAEFIQHEYIQYCYSSGIHKYVNIG